MSEGAITLCARLRALCVFEFPTIKHWSVAMQRRLQRNAEGASFPWMLEVEPGAISSSTFNTGRSLGVLLNVGC
jgi:hypothetical protein